MDRFVYKILTPEAWEDFRASGTFTGSADDKRDGFIHLSNKDQLQGTLDKHYNGHRKVIIAEFEASALGDALKYEISRGGAAFPHLYAALELTHMTQFWPLSASARGGYAVSKILG